MPLGNREGPPVIQNKVSQTGQSMQSPVIPHTETTASALSAATEVHYVRPQRQSRLLSLVEGRCIVNGFMDNHPVLVLWDTGAQSSIVNDIWWQNHLPQTIVMPISDLMEETLTVFAANDTAVHYIGWIEVSFRLDSRHK